MKRRLAPNEREILSLGTLTLTTTRVVLLRRRWWGEACEAVPLDRVDSTAVVAPRWGSPRLVVRAGRARLVLRCPDVSRLRGLADAIDHAAQGLVLEREDALPHQLGPVFAEP
jgi:hypothetical protein